MKQNKISILLGEFNKMIEEKASKKEIDSSTKIHKLLSFFFSHGNSGINALREILEEANDDDVEVIFDDNQNNFIVRMCICYELHDFEIVEYVDRKDTQTKCFQIIDTTRKDIETIKMKFKELKL